MPKNIVICCDGTNNQFDGDHTNVIRTYKVAVRNEAQLTFYDPGVGTIPEPWFTSRLAKRWSMLKGLAFGSGFSENVCTAYTSLMPLYEPGDRVFLFGFSRGAYTARAVAAMLHSVGLLEPGAENLVRYAQNYWRKDRGPESPGGRLCAEFKATLARPCPVHFVGVWDTVGSVGFINHFKTFPHTYHNPSVTSVRHAVSIDERRCCFRQNLMAPAFTGQDVKNVWFAGVHSDVGGGYPADQAGLARLAFRWMMTEAQQCGLLVDQTAYERELAPPGAPDPLAPQHESLRGPWWLIECLPTRVYSFRDHRRHWRLTLGRRRSVLESAAEPGVFMHRSVVDRLGGSPNYRPSNLPATPAELERRFHVVG